jgi:serine/threonine-protein kinase
VTDAENLARILPGYVIGAELGRGGYGVVLAGVHKQLGRHVAIKELPPKLATDPGVRARFVAEARVLASLDHPHIVPVYDFVEQDGVCVLVMEALPGGTVWGHFSDFGYTPSAACAVVMVACAGLHHAHQHGVLHRDVKPENLLLTDTGQLKVADFGIAKVLGDNDALATNNGEILGTPAYIAPEQAQGGDLGPPADVYAAGVMLYELLSGKLPFSEEGGGLAIVYRHVYEQPTALLDVAPNVPPALAAVVMKALSTDAQQRYPSAEAFGVAIGEAATRVFGPGWFEDTAVPVLGGGPILASTQPLPPPTTGYDEAVTTPAATRTPAPATRALPPIRPVTVAHVRGAAVDASAEAVVPVRQVLANPPWPVPWAVLTAAVVGLVAVLALVGVGSASARPAPGAVLVAGQDAAALPVVDLSKPFDVRAAKLPQARGANQVLVDLAIAGVPLVSSSVGKPGAAGTVPVDARGSRYLAAGTIQATVSFRRDGTELATVTFPLRTKRSAFLSVPGIAAVIALLFVLAYAESQLAPLRRRGRRRWSSLIGLAFAGAVLGGLAAVFAWLTSTDELLTSTLSATAAAGAVAGVLLGVTTYKAGRRSRLRRIARKQGLTPG